MKTEDIQFVASLPHVREVSIVGTADLGFWVDRLKDHGLVPLDRGGQAEILIIAADSWFWGVSFQELSFSIALSKGAFLGQAFNSRRFFAFCERAVFKTPYAFGDVQVSVSPASVHLHRNGDRLFRAEQGKGEPEAAASPYEKGFEGPLYLPSGRGFLARIRGESQPAAFQPARDVLELRPARELPFLQDLIDSGFQATHWLVRPDSSHAKSKTYPKAFLDKR